MEIGRLVAQKIKLARLVAHAVLSKELHRLVERPSRRLVVVEKISAEKDEVDLFLPGNLQDLLKGVDGVRLANGVLLHVAEVVVGSGSEDGGKQPRCRVWARCVAAEPPNALNDMSCVRWRSQEWQRAVQTRGMRRRVKVGRESQDGKLTRPA